MVGRTAAVPLVAGALLSPGQIGPAAWPAAGEAVVALPLKPGRIPAGIAAGARVQVLVVAASTATGTDTGPPPQGRLATVVEVAREVDASGTVVVSLLLRPSDAQRWRRPRVRRRWCCSGRRGDVAMRIAVGSLKGAPGVTTFGLALAVCWPEPGVLLVECDPAGGDLGGRFATADVPGLAGLAVDARRDRSPSVWHAHAQRLPVGADVVVAPASGRQASAALAQLVDHLPAVDGDLIIDVGRIGDASPARSLIAVADAVVVVSGAELSAIDRAAAFSQSVSTTDAMLHARLSVVVVGDSPWPQRELADVFGVPVVTAPYDKRSAAILTGSARPRGAWTRVGLPAAARTLALQLRTPAVEAKESPQSAAQAEPVPVEEVRR